jgi:EAL domain-containing protein (putative c-di-GMP-specific phosphodiesterase class I)
MVANQRAIRPHTPRYDRPQPHGWRDDTATLHPGACSFHELEFFYQPILDVRPRGVSAFEALLRWRHPSGAVLAPAFFLARLMTRIDPGELSAFTVRRVVDGFKRWSGPTRVHVAINFSPEQLLEDMVPELIAGLHDAGRFQLEVEVTEQPIRDLKHLARVLQDLRELGVRVLLDDITPSPLSLELIEALEIDGVKLDSALLTRSGTMLEDDPERQRVLRDFIGRLKDRGLSVTAEGVNTPFQSGFLAESGCDHLQGFNLGGPLSFAQVAERYGGDAALAPNTEEGGDQDFIYLLTGTEAEGDTCRTRIREYAEAQRTVAGLCKGARELGHRETLR